MLMSDPLTSGALSRPGDDDPRCCRALPESERHTWIPAKIPQYSNDCLTVGKIRTCEIFADNGAHSDVFPENDLECGEGVKPCERIRDGAPVALFASVELVRQLLPAGISHPAGWFLIALAKGEDRRRVGPEQALDGRHWGSRTAGTGSVLASFKTLFL
jgi:hypothetical protein